jgi:hypothetical protein
MEEKLKMPVSQRVYGEVIYWITVVAAIICMVGPVIAMISVDNNVMNPHYLFAEITYLRRFSRVRALQRSGRQ